jgi:hypothetical protein
MEKSVTGAVPKCVTAHSKRIRVKVVIDRFIWRWGFAIEADDKEAKPHVKDDLIDLPLPIPEAEIEFRIHQRGGKRLEFRQADPIWIQRDECPGEEVPCNVGNEVCIIECTENRLRLLDRNTVDAVLHFRLWFVDEDNDLESWDPAIRNGGGGRR